MIFLDTAFKLPLLDTMRVPYAIITDGEGATLVLVATEAPRLFSEMNAEGIIDTAELESLQQGVNNLSLLENADQVREAIRLSPLDEEKWEVNFHVHNGFDRVQGDIVTTEGPLLNFRTIGNLVEAIDCLSERIDDGEISINTGIHVLKQCAEIGLPI